MKLLGLILILCGNTFAAITNVTVQGASSTQAIITYTAPNLSACTVEVSEQSDYTPLVEDVDPVLYPGSDSDNRTGNLGASTRSRIIVVGKRGQHINAEYTAIQTAADGHNRSRALKASTIYHGRITCGGDSAGFTFQTANIPVGDTRGEPLMYDPEKSYGYLGVTGVSALYPEFADPQTGARVVRGDTTYGRFGYGGSSASWPGSPAIHGDCNQVLTTPVAVKGSCLFDGATGTNWTATTGTLNDAVRADDSNYAEYSGTAQEPLRLRLGQGKFVRSSTSEEVGYMSFQNKILRVRTTDATGDGGQFEMCVTPDVIGDTGAGETCVTPWMRHTLTDTNEATIRFCHKANCTEEEGERPGESMWNSGVDGFQLHPGVRMYNTDPDFDKLKFTGDNALAFCNKLFVDEYIFGMTAQLLIPGNRITAKNCGASPPEVTISVGKVYSHNGTDGLGVYTLGAPWTGGNDPYSNPRYGALVRKVSTTSGATLKVGMALWRYAANTPITMSFGSGGFGKRCANIPMADGYYPCSMTMQIVGIKHNADGTLAMKNYGHDLVIGSHWSVNLQTDQVNRLCLGGASNNDSTWSDTEPGVFYCALPSNYNNPAISAVDNRPVIAKLTLDPDGVVDGDPDASGGPGLGNKNQRVALLSVEILTPCNASPCNSVGDDYTPYAQRKRFNSDWDASLYNACGLQAAQGNFLFEVCRSGQQDSPAWVFAYDLGNGLPVGAGYVGTYGNTQQLMAGFHHPSVYASRDCGMHTFQASMGLSPGTALPFAVVEPGNKCPMTVIATTSLPSCTIGSTCDVCPTLPAVNGYDYSGQRRCSNFTWGSSCSFVGAPAGCVDGDPVSSGCSDAPNLKWLHTMAVGDFLQHNNELIMLLRKDSNTSGVVVRGWGSQATNSSFPISTHNDAVSWATRCNDDTLDDPVGAYPERERGLVWFPALDPTGTNINYTFTDPHTNHAWHVGRFGSNPAYLMSSYTDPTDPANVKNPTSFVVVHLPSYFGSKPSNWNGDPDALGIASGIGSCSGNGCDKHPAYGQIAGDDNARSWFVDIPKRLYNPVNKTAATLVAGKNHIYRWNATIQLFPKHYDFDVYTGFYPFRRSNTLTDSSASTGKWCKTVLADDCFAGSLANTQYVTFTELDKRWIEGTDGNVNSTCRDAEFGSGQWDLCFGQPSGIGAALTQWRLMTRTEYNGYSVRALSRVGRYFREAATENAKTDPLGKTILSRSNLYWIPPPFPGESSKTLETFLTTKITIGAVPPGTSTAYVEFGYNSDLRCSLNYDATCIAESATLNESNPFQWSVETITGVSCSSGCSITIPAIANRILYYRIVFRNAGGTVIHTGAKNVMAI